ncbi:MAG: phosphatidylserine decarboxylase family protein [bacterium]|nr:phosphatidylserine decarboxylase family protein [bacterium]MDT8365914.1 phosphatidylserine decarboxylase family protein [bacterium]
MSVVAREGIPHISIPSFLAVILLLTGYPLGGAAAGIVAISVALFFRDPERAHSAGPGEILSPADGRIVAVDRVQEDRHLDGGALRISVFMSIFNVHVNRVPMDASVVTVKHISGGFAMAHLDDAGLINERTEILLVDSSGRKSLMVQVAGLVARRIICRLRQGDDVVRGSRFGLICFGSRVDLYLPEKAQPLARIGDRVRAGQSVLAQM